MDEVTVTRHRQLLIENLKKMGRKLSWQIFIWIAGALFLDDSIHVVSGPRSAAGTYVV